VVVLDERPVRAGCLPEEVVPETLVEEPAVVAVDHRLEHEHAPEIGLDYIHIAAPIPMLSASAADAQNRAASGLAGVVLFSTERACGFTGGRVVRTP
jgi:hypothetical protein